MAIRNTGVLYEINAHTYLTKLSKKLGRTITFGDIPDEELERLAKLGVGAVWFMGVWKRSPRSVHIGKQAGLLKEFGQVLPDIQEDDLIGSAYSVRDYHVDPRLGGEGGLADLRSRLKARGIDLMLDFVPNHTAPDHPWVTEHPEYYIRGSEKELTEDPDSYIDADGTILANGRDPQFPAWSDVVQLNAFSTGYRQAVVETLRWMAQICDGVRCDMAMLMMNDIFAKNWGKKANEPPERDFWEEVIASVREVRTDFIFLAEVYWDREEALLEQGFDFCYDKTLYDLLLGDSVDAVLDHLHKTAPYQDHLARFIENHDEERAAAAYVEKHEAAAAIIATLPGLWLFHDGQAEGHKTKIPVHLARGPEEGIDEKLYEFYTRLLEILSSWKLHKGSWNLLVTDTKKVIAYEWLVGGHRYIVVVNYAGRGTHANLRLPFDGKVTAFTDGLSGKSLQSTDSPHGSVLKCRLDPWQILLLSSS